MTLPSKALAFAEQQTRLARERQAAKERQEADAKEAARGARLQADLENLQRPLALPGAHCSPP